MEGFKGGQPKMGHEEIISGEFFPEFPDVFEKADPRAFRRDLKGGGVFIEGPHKEGDLRRGGIAQGLGRGKGKPRGIFGAEAYQDFKRNRYGFFRDRD
jgi:hypothetical protein